MGTQNIFEGRLVAVDVTELYYWRNHLRSVETTGYCMDVCRWQAFKIAPILIAAQSCGVNAAASLEDNILNEAAVLIE